MPEFDLAPFFSYSSSLAASTLSRDFSKRHQTTEQQRRHHPMLELQMHRSRLKPPGRREEELWKKKPPKHLGVKDKPRQSAPPEPQQSEVLINQQRYVGHKLWHTSCILPLTKEQNQLVCLRLCSHRSEGI